MRPKTAEPYKKKNKEIKNHGNEITKLEVTDFLSSDVFQIQDIAQKNCGKVTLQIAPILHRDCDHEVARLVRAWRLSDWA